MGSGPVEEHHHLELSWYAIHPIELLFTLMGPGCQEVTRTSGEGSAASDVLVGRWKDGRVGTVRTLRPYGDYGVTVFRPKAVERSQPKVPFSYAPLAKQIVQFFETGKPPVPNEDTLEITIFWTQRSAAKSRAESPSSYAGTRHPKGVPDAANIDIETSLLLRLAYGDVTL